MACLKVALQKAVDEGNIEMVGQLLEKGANPDFMPHWMYHTLGDSTLERNHLEIIKLLLQFKRNNALLEKLFKTISAKKYKNSLSIDIMKTLLDNGLKINEFVPDQAGVPYCTPFHVCISNGKTDLVKFLLDNGADIHEQTRCGESCLMLAINANNKHIIELLLKAGHDVNEKSLYDEKTPLHEACELPMELPGRLDIVYLLLKNGADINRKDDSGRTPLAYDPFCTDECKRIFVIELAKMSLEKRPICAENLAYIKHHKKLQSLFDQTLVDLKLIKQHDLD